MGTHRSYLISMGQIQPTKITFISMSFNSSSQKYANFRVHTYPPMEVKPFHTNRAYSIQSETHASCFILASPPFCSSRPSGARYPPTGASPDSPDGPTRPTAPLTAPPTRPVPQLMALLARSMPQPMAPPARVVPHRRSSTGPPPPKRPRRLSASTEQCRPPAPRWPPPSNAALLLLVCHWPP
jgi:hypothetical protein